MRPFLKVFPFFYIRLGNTYFKLDQGKPWAELHCLNTLQCQLQPRGELSPQTPEPFCSCSWRPGEVEPLVVSASSIM